MPSDFTGCYVAGGFGKCHPEPETLHAHPFVLTSGVPKLAMPKDLGPPEAVALRCNLDLAVVSLCVFLFWFWVSGLGGLWAGLEASGWRL